MKFRFSSAAMSKPAQATREGVPPEKKLKTTVYKNDSAQTRNNPSTENLENSRFSKPFSCSDNIVFQVEGRLVHVSKVTVRANSPVFDAMTVDWGLQCKEQDSHFTV